MTQTIIDPITGEVRRNEDGAGQVYGLARAGGSASTGVVYKGFYSITVSGSVTFVFVDGGTVVFTPVAGTHYPWHGQFTVISGGTYIGFL